MIDWPYFFFCIVLPMFFICWTIIVAAGRIVEALFEIEKLWRRITVQIERMADDE